MADIGAITSVTNVARSVFGNKRIVIGYITYGDDSDTFPVAGLSLTPGDVGMSAIELILFDIKSVGIYYDYTNEVIKPVATGAGDGLAFNIAGSGGIPANGETVRFIAIGYGCG